MTAESGAAGARMLQGQAAVVTGAGRGLGLAYSRALAAAGALVVVNDADAALAEDAARSIEAAGGRVAAHPGPVGAAEVAEALAARAVSEFGRLDILVTNVGILRDAVLWKMTDDDFDAVLSVHLRGTFTCVRAAATPDAGPGPGRPDHLHRLADRAGRQLRPDQLRRGQGRHRRHDADLGPGAGWPGPGSPSTR